MFGAGAGGASSLAALQGAGAGLGGSSGITAGKVADYLQKAQKLQEMAGGQQQKPAAPAQRPPPQQQQYADAMEYLRRIYGGVR
jgi:hypothetical protein